MRTLVVIVSMLLGACGATPANESEPASETTTEPATESEPVTHTEPPVATTPRHARATRGAAIVEITDTPGFLIDGNAPPPPPGTPPARHVAVTASCIGDVAGCSEAGTVVRRAQSFDEAVAGLRALGFDVAITP